MDNAKEVKKGQRKDYLRKRKRRKIEVGVKFYDQWEKIGSLEGLKTDTQIVKFLIQQYENMRETTACCVRCQTPLTLFCTKCLLPAAEAQAAQKRLNLQTTGAGGKNEVKSGAASLPSSAIKTEPIDEDTELQTNKTEDRMEMGDSDTEGTEVPAQPFRLEVPIDNSDEEELASGASKRRASASCSEENSVIKTEKNEKGNAPSEQGDSQAASAVSENDDISDPTLAGGQSEETPVKTEIVEFTSPVALKSDQPLGLPYQKKYKRGEKPSRCSICEVIFPTRPLMKQHKIAEHSVERPYQCTLCNAAFKVKKHRKDHMLSHTGEKPFLCTVCGVGFSFHCGLKTHMRTHTKERPFVCKTCGAAFMQSCNLKVHLRTHTGERPFVCNVCGFAFTTSSHLIRHMYTHADERQYACKECGRAFKTPACLKAHERTHKGEKPAQCPVCGARFANTAYIKVHMRSHTGERPYACDICNATFKESGKLTKHKRQNHR